MYLIALVTVTVVFSNVDPVVAQRAMAWASTDAHNLRHHPVPALIVSAFWLPPTQPWIWAIMVAVALAALEIRIGTGWTAAVFVSGHVLATLVTELPVLWAVEAQLLPRADSHLLDIGVSYGLFTVIGALLRWLPRSLRWWAVLAVVACILAMYLEADPSTLDSIVTMAGHLASMLIGTLGWWPCLRRLDPGGHRSWLAAGPRG